ERQVETVNRASRRARRVLPMALAVALLGTVGSVVVWHTMRTMEDEVTATSFQGDAEERELGIVNELDGSLETLRYLASFFDSSTAVSREQFGLFTAPILKRHDPAIQAFGWNRRVSREVREAFEREGKAEWSDAFEITERGPEGDPVRAEDRDTYVSVMYLEPLAGNEPALGFDIASEPKRAAALAMADETGDLSITAPISLVQDDDGPRPGFLACIPIGKAGYVVGVYRAQDIVEAALEDFGPAALAIQLRDTEEGMERDLLLPDMTPQAAESELVHRSTQEVGGRTWILEIRPTAAYLAARRGWGPLVALLVGLLFTALACAYVSLLLNRSARIAALVDERTDALSRANEGLEREVAQRQRAEHELTKSHDALEDTVRDRTAELEQAVGDLRTSDERHRLTLEAMSDGAWDWNLETGEIFCSPSWLRALGYEPEDAPPAMAFLERILRAEDLATARETLDAHFEGKVPQFELRSPVRHRNGELRWNLARGRVVARDAQGQPLRMVGTNTDITERVEAEAERREMEHRLQHSQKLESLGVLAGGIAHDFNNLLVAIMGGAEMALQASAPDGPTKKSLDMVLLASKRAADLTEQMLAYAGRNTISREPVRLPELVREMAQLLRSSKSKKAELRIEADRDVPAVEGDRTQLRQVVMNLITNASDAIGDKAGSIVLRVGARRVERGELDTMVLGERLRPGEYVTLEVSDTGIGMDMATVERIFDPFFTTKFQGRGLGLAAILGIIRGHGGAIRVESQPNVGTTFRLLLPRAHKTDALPADPLRPELSPSACTVLIIDDEDLVRGIAAEILEEASFHVLQAPDGPEGIELYREQLERIGVVILDMTMPRMSGTEVIRELHRIQPDMPVLFTSGYSEVEVEKAVLEFGAAGFIKKPYGIQSLLDAVRDAIRRSKLATPTAGDLGSGE
ncbi:MAG: CHASE domain-containing protein, partial [Planctomycetota bacterium]|nr:CHASE domain-containing protein [Planctomycetota bacterium]